jgi:NADH-quinone oxidoreductase subunit E
LLYKERRETHCYQKGFIMYAKERMLSGSDFQEPQMTDVVVIDDEESICEGCRQTLEAEGLRAAIAKDGTDGLKLVEQSHPKVVLVDLKMPGISGMEVLAKISEYDPSIVTIVITGYGSIDSAVETMKIGATDFLTKPFTPERLVESVKRGIEQRRPAEQTELTEQAVQPLEAPEKGPLNKQNVVLKGLEVLGQYYSLGFKERQFFDELRHLESESKYHADRLGQVKEKGKAVLDIVLDLRRIDKIIEKYDYKKNALIQILLDIQTEFNWLPRHCLEWVSTRLNIPHKDIYTIANFYEALSLEPRGAHLIQVCTGTACHVRGAAGLVDRVSSILGIEPGQTDSEQLFTLETVHCLGCCALGPVMVVDGKYYSNPSTKQIEEIAASCRTNSKKGDSYAQVEISQ